MTKIGIGKFLYVRENGKIIPIAQIILSQEEFFDKLGRALDPPIVFTKEDYEDKDSHE
jgi:hypothetical protein